MVQQPIPCKYDSQHLEIIKSEVDGWLVLPPEEQQSKIQNLAKRHDSFGFGYCLYPLMYPSTEDQLYPLLDLFTKFLEILETCEQNPSDSKKSLSQQQEVKLFWRMFWAVLIGHAESDKQKSLKFLELALGKLDASMSKCCDDLIQEFIVDECKKRVITCKSDSLNISEENRGEVNSTYLNYCTFNGGRFLLESILKRASETDLARKMVKKRFKKSLFMENWDRQNVFKFCKVLWSNLQKHEIELLKGLSYKLIRYVFDLNDLTVCTNLKEIADYIISATDPKSSSNLYGQILKTIVSYQISAYDDEKSR